MKFIQIDTVQKRPVKEHPVTDRQQAERLISLMEDQKKISQRVETPASLILDYGKYIYLIVN
jgi:translation initiation factor IF-3